MANLRGSVDELKFDVLLLPVGCRGEDRLTEDHDALLDTENLTLDEEPVISNLTIVGEATHWSDRFLDGVLVAHGVVRVVTSTDSVDLLVDFGTGVVTLLTTAGDRPLDGSRMPSTDTTDLAETSVRLSSQLLAAVSLDNTLSTLTLGDTNSVNTLILGEDLTDGDLLLELGEAPVDLLLNAATVNLDFDDVGLLLSEVKLLGLRCNDNADN